MTILRVYCGVSHLASEDGSASLRILMVCRQLFPLVRLKKKLSWGRVVMLQEHGVLLFSFPLLLILEERVVSVAFGVASVKLGHVDFVAVSNLLLETADKIRVCEERHTDGDGVSGTLFDDLLSLLTLKATVGDESAIKVLTEERRAVDFSPIPREEVSAHYVEESNILLLKGLCHVWDVGLGGVPSSLIIRYVRAEADTNAVRTDLTIARVHYVKEVLGAGLDGLAAVNRLVRRALVADGD